MEQKSEYEKFKAIRVPLKDGGKFFVYFKRYVPSEVNKVSSLYQLIEKLSEKEIIKNEIKEKEKIKVSESRTMIFVNFDRPFQEAKLKKLLKSVGRIRKISIGRCKKDGKILYVGLVVFNKAKEMMKCFDLEWFQHDVDKRYKGNQVKADPDSKLEYKINLLSKYDVEESKPIVDNDGFTLVTGETGIDPEITREIEQVRRKKKKKSVLTDFYKFQVRNKEFVDESQLPDYEVLKRKKKRLQESFKLDVAKLKSMGNDLKAIFHKEISTYRKTYIWGFKIPSLLLEFEPLKNEKTYQKDFMTYMKLKDSIHEFGNEYMQEEKEQEIGSFENLPSSHLSTITIDSNKSDSLGGSFIVDILETRSLFNEFALINHILRLHFNDQDNIFNFLITSFCSLILSPYSSILPPSSPFHFSSHPSPPFLPPLSSYPPSSSSGSLLRLHSTLLSSSSSIILPHLKDLAKQIRIFSSILANLASDFYRLPHFCHDSLPIVQKNLLLLLENLIFLQIGGSLLHLCKLDENLGKPDSPTQPGTLEEKMKGSLKSEGGWKKEGEKKRGWEENDGRKWEEEEEWREEEETKKKGGRIMFWKRDRKISVDIFEKKEEEREVGEEEEEDEGRNDEGEEENWRREEEENLRERIAIFKLMPAIPSKKRVVLKEILEEAEEVLGNKWEEVVDEDMEGEILFAGLFGLDD